MLFLFSGWLLIELTIGKLNNFLIAPIRLSLKFDGYFFIGELDINILIVLAAISGALHIYFDFKKRVKQSYITKPLTILLLIIYAIKIIPSSSYNFQIFATLGLSLSLVGDVFLMIKNKDYFIYGLAAFLLAHLSYLTAVILDTGFQLNFLVLLVITLGLLLFMYKIVSSAGTKKIYVLVYSLVIVLLLWQAIVRSLYIPNSTTIIFAIGIAFFVISDSILAYNKFVKEKRNAQFYILSTYYAAQILIVLSI